MLPNPRDTANVFSKLFLTWTVPLFVKGYKSELSVEDIYQPSNSDRSGSLGDRLEKNWNKQTKTANPSLLVAVFKTFWKEYTVLTLICAINDVVLRIGQPLLLGLLLSYFRQGSDVSYENALIYASGTVFLIGCNALLSNIDLFTAMRNAMKVRVAICSMIYRKALRLSNTAFGETAPGKVVNLLSNDVTRFDYASMLLNSMWTAPLLTIIVAILLWIEIGLPGIIGIMIVFVVVPIQSYAGRVSSRLRLRMAFHTDERSRFMDEIISGVQVIKMYAWEKPFAQLIMLTRKSELAFVREINFIRALFMTFALFTTRMAVFCTMLSMALLYRSDNIVASKIFVVSSYYTILSVAMSQMFVRGVAEISEALVAFKRLQDFLELEEKDTSIVAREEKINSEPHHGQKNTIKHINLSMSGNVSVSLKNVTARWILPTTSKNFTQSDKKKVSKSKKLDDCVEWTDKTAPPKPLATLDGLSIEIEKGKLIGIVGSIGTGKTSLLQVILRELPIDSGSININGTISYASQEPWMFGGTIRQNILFGQEYDRERYDAVIKACALVRDFEELADGDRTVIGERGASLSGGQKARVNLARATYRRADIYLLDDPLSALDSHVGTHIFNKCIGPRGRLANLNTTRILVTHQIHFLKAADWLIVLQDGKIVAQGTPANLSKRVDLAALEAEERSEPPTPTNISRTFSRIFSRQISIQSTTSCLDELKDNDEEDQLSNIEFEATSKGTAGRAGAMSYFKAGANWPVLIVLFTSFLFVQFLASFADFWVSVWTNYEECISMNQGKPRDPESDDKRPTFLGLIELSTENCIYVQATIMAGLFIIGLARSLGFFMVGVKSSRKLHNGMFQGIISTKMRFFDTNPCGRILNRFSKDMGAVDEMLPRVVFDAAQIILNIAGIIIITAIVNPIFLVPVFVLSIVFVFIRKAYLKTSKSIKRLEGSAKSPVFTHLATTLNGLPTIRAYNAEKTLIKEFDSHQDIHTACWFMFISTTSALGFSLNLISFLFIGCIIFVFMNFDTGISDGKIGLVITQAMSLATLLQWGVRHSAEVSNQLTAVERIVEYRDQESEVKPDESPDTDENMNWPTNGRIEFKNVIYRYFEEAEPVLRGLSFEIKPREKIGIVGRTGAGKSSLIGAIFRLACVEGEILIDDVDTSAIPATKLRSSIAIIPQDPVLFSGTLRRNLDPFGEYNDADIWDALEKVELKQTSCCSLGLDSCVSARGSNFSVGQRQLICLARAILRKNRILVLDEATANVDPKTDLLIQETIREQFEDCTVLTVAHRLHTIIDSDRILVMDAGRAIEFDEAHILLQNKSSIFSGMLKTLGLRETKRLSQCALEKFNENRSSTESLNSRNDMK